MGNVSQYNNSFVCMYGIEAYNTIEVYAGTILKVKFI